MISNQLAWMATRPDEDRRAMGQRAAETVANWGPDRFARGAMEALDFARSAHERTRTRTTSATTKVR